MLRYLWQYLSNPHNRLKMALLVVGSGVGISTLFIFLSLHINSHFMNVSSQINNKSIPIYKIRQFPFPPPKPSARADIPQRFLVKPDVPQTLLKDVAERLREAFEQAGYGEKSWYQFPNGFALVSRLEQINSDGSPKEKEVRWIPSVDSPPIFSLTSYLKTLFTAPEGHYRVIVFLVTDQDLSLSKQTVSREEAMEWLDTGYMELPPGIGAQPYTSNHYCKALIYEFEQKDQNPIPKIPSDLQGEDHLKKAKLWTALGG